MEDINEIRRILVRAPNWIGDAVMCLPALESLKALYPASVITVLAKGRVIPVFQNNPAVAGIMEYDDRGAHSGFRGRLQLSGEIRKGHFDMAVLFQNAFEAAFLAFISGVPRRAGYARDLRTQLLTDPVPLTEEIKRKHQAFYYLDIIRYLGGADVASPAPRIYISAEESAWADGFLKENGLYGADLAGAAPGASYGPAKRWMSGNYAAALTALSKEYKAVPVIFGGPEDADVCREVEQGITEGITEGTTDRHLNLAGKINLRQFMAILARLKVFITNDSGPMHISAALGVPTVAVFGSTDPFLTGPLGKTVRIITKNLECSPCFDRNCRYGHYRCLAEVGPDEVIGAAAAFLKEGLGKMKTEDGAVAVFLDRDGTINEDVGYLAKPDELTLISGSANAIKRLNGMGIKVIVVTNQSGVARGYFTAKDVHDVNGRLTELLGLYGAHADGIYYCPHHPDEDCACRKPKGGLVVKAAQEHAIDVGRSYVVGDKASDVELAGNLNARGVLVLTGNGPEELNKLKRPAAFVAPDLSGAAEWIIADIERRSR